MILTHKHIDHIGNAWRIQQASNAELLIHESEMQAIADVDPEGVRFQELVTELHKTYPESFVQFDCDLYVLY